MDINMQMGENTIYNPVEASHQQQLDFMQQKVIFFVSFTAKSIF